MVCDIYGILCLANDKLYVDSSVNVENRVVQHLKIYGQNGRRNVK